MSECEHLARTSAYFDGALAPADEAEAAAHLATCAPCQQLLDDAVGLDVALAGAKRRAPARSSRWPAIVLAGVAAAGVLVLVWPRHPGPHHDRVALQLPGERALEARFSGPTVGPYRPRAAVRAQRQPIEAVPLTALAELEQHGDPHDLIGALAASGDLRRATELATRLPDDARGASDRAALALAAGDPVAALAHAQHALSLDPELAPARWNLALAARDLHLDHVAHAAFAALAARGEPGWSREAADRAKALEDELAIEDGYPAFEAASQAMIAGGAPLTADEAERYPAPARIAFYDAARLAPDRARLAALRPLAAALDQASGTSTATAALERIDPAVTSRFAAGYRAILDHTATAAQMTALIDQLRAAGRGADDLRLGAIILAGQSAQRLGELRAIAAPWNDPWFLHFIEREELRARYPDGDPRALGPLSDALAHCTGDAWAHRCGQLANDLARLELSTGHDAEAEAAARRAVALYRTAMSPVLLGRARALLADLHRLQGRTALARAELEDVVLAAGDRDCDGVRYSRISEAEMAIVDGDWSAARTALPPATAPAGCTGAVDLLGIAVAIDLARATGDPRDHTAAQAWLATAGTLADGGLATLGALRLGTGDPAAAKAWIAAHAHTTDRDAAGIRTWGITTLIDDAGAHAAWPDVLAQAGAPEAACTVVASADDDRVTIAIRTAAGVTGDHRRVPVRDQATARLVPEALVARLAGCADIAVVARPPLHGRSDLLPPELPWWFAGDAAPNAPGTAPPHAVEVTDARPPDPALPAIGIAPSSQRFDVHLTGTAATPAHVLAALASATYAELDVHGVTGSQQPDAAYLALSPDATGAYALHAGAVAAARLAAHPVVVLAACHTASVAPYLRQRWSLPDAFVTAGASAVIAADVAIPDAEARPVFDELHRRIAAGEPVAAAVAAVRKSATSGWIQHLMVFR